MYRVMAVALSMVFFSACAGAGQSGDTEADSEAAGPEILGRWDVTVGSPDTSYPSWFQIERSGEDFTGQFVGRVGSARPIQTIDFSGGKLAFSLPVQYESHKTDMRFEGQLEAGHLKGTTNVADGSTLPWTAVRAPELPAPLNPQWGEPIQLFNGSDLAGWKPRDPEAPNMWQAQDGVLANTGRGTDLITEQTFQDFRLHLEFKYPEGSNSGVYLRGRYEVQIQDDYGKEPGSRFIGGVYGFLTPSKNAGRPAGEWQTYDITLLGRRITITLNGETVIDNQEIPGITGGALSAREEEPGPLMLQGDHGPISFRNLVLTPVADSR
ncbi:MAG: DUF1080 domain-containing protein [Acidobacteriota bacterium]